MTLVPRTSRKRRTRTQARAARRARRLMRRRIVGYVVATAVAIVAAAFIASLFLPGLPISFGRGTPDGPGLKMPDMGGTHITLDQNHPPYNSIPATSGWHYVQPLAPARWGRHDKPLRDEVLVHNLEHGGIGVHYNCPEGCDQLLDDLSAIVSTATANGTKILLAPYPNTDTIITLTAWTFIDRFDVFDQERITSFIDAHESSPNAPEYNVP